MEAATLTDAPLTPKHSAILGRKWHRPLSKLEGVVVLGGTMAGLVALSSVLSSYLAGKAPDNMKSAVNTIVSQIFGIGIAGLGAPLFSPASAKFTQRAFGLGRRERSFERHAATDLEKLWWRSQENYSVNANMARNVVSHYLVSIHNNISCAYQALRDPEQVSYAVARVAEAAFRLRTLFAEIHPDDQIIASSVRTGLGDHLTGEESRTFRARVVEELQRLDPHFHHPGVDSYYLRLLNGWLPLSSAPQARL
jgi:hypothetical protein